MPHELPEFERRLHDLLDDRLRPEDDAWLQSQAALSEEHRDLLKGQQVMLDGVELLDTPDLPADFAERCVSLAIDGDAQPTPPHKVHSQAGRWSVVGWISVCAAALALVAAVPLWNLMQVEPEIRATVPNPSESGPSDESPEEQPPSDDIPDSSIANVPTEQLHLDSESNLPGDQREPDAVAQRNYDDLIRQAFEDWRERDEELFPPRPQWVDDVALGFRPVADSVGGAINVLRRNLPPSPRVEGEEKPQAGLQPSGAASSVS